MMLLAFPEGTFTRDKEKSGKGETNELDNPHPAGLYPDRCFVNHALHERYDRRSNFERMDGVDTIVALLSSVLCPPGEAAIQY
jgi:hypothetical protein